MRYYICLIFLFFQLVQSRLIIGNETIPISIIPLNSNTSSITTNNYVIVKFDDTTDTFEELISGYDTPLIIVETNNQGTSYLYTSGKHINTDNIIIVEIKKDDIKYLNNTTNITIIIDSKNTYMVLSDSILWWSLQSLIGCLIIAITVIISVKIFHAGIKKFDTIIWVVIIYIGLILRFMYIINICGLNLLYHYKFTYVMSTVYIPFYIVSHLLATDRKKILIRIIYVVLGLVEIINIILVAVYNDYESLKIELIMVK